MNADIRNAMLKITTEDGTEILGRVESLEMTRPIYGMPLDDIYPQPICNQMVCVFDMFRVNAPKVEEVPAFDLDKACADAMSRVQAHIDEEFAWLDCRINNRFNEAIWDSNSRHDHAIKEHRSRLRDFGYFFTGGVVLNYRRHARYTPNRSLYKEYTQ